MTIEHSEGERERRVGDILPLAEALHEAIERRLTAKEATGTSDIDRIIDQAFGDVAREVAVSRLERLSPPEFVELYVRLRGERELGELLETLRSIKEQQLRREARLAQIGQEALATGMMRLELLEPNEVIELGLFDPLAPHLAERQFADDPEQRPLRRRIGARVLDPSTGTILVLHDTWVAPVWARDPQGELLRPHTRGQIGVPNESGLDPAISHRTSLAYRVIDEEDLVIPEQLVGYVQMNSGEVLLG